MESLTVFIQKAASGAREGLLSLRAGLFSSRMCCLTLEKPLFSVAQGPQLRDRGPKGHTDSVNAVRFRQSLLASPLGVSSWFPARQHPHFSRTCWECELLGPIPLLLNEKLWKEVWQKGGGGGGGSVHVAEGVLAVPFPTGQHLSDSDAQA